MTIGDRARAAAPHALLGAWCLAVSIYFILFAFHVVGWKSFHLIAWSSTVALMAFSSTGAVRQYDGNRFMLQNKRSLVTAALATVASVLAIGYALKGTAYQTAFLGILLAGANLSVTCLLFLGARRATRGPT